MIKAPNETALVRQCLELLHLAGIFAWRQNTGCTRYPATKLGGRARFVRFGEPGISDIIGLLSGSSLWPRGVFFCVECKTAKGRLTPAQEAFQQRVRESGGVALCVRSVQELADKLTRRGFNVPAVGAKQPEARTP